VNQLLRGDLEYTSPIGTVCCDGRHPAHGEPPSQGGIVDILADWRDGATSLVWRSTTEANDGADVTVFVRRTGTPGAPALVCVHGFPTSSIDYYALARELAAEFEIFVLDFPGYGLSDKPPAPYVYSLFDDARLLVHAITEVWKLTDYLMVTHDRGSSVGMIALDILAAQHPGAVPADVVMTNANIYLPLANLTAFQTALLDDATGRATGAGDDAGAVGGGPRSEHVHAAADPGGPGDRSLGEVLCTQRRHSGAAGHHCVSARARRARNPLARSTFQERRQPFPGLGRA
jgi:pimeloyl-ACP methyl ester carboxylesterase